MASPTSEQTPLVGDILTGLEGPDEFPMSPERGASWQKWALRLAVAVALTALAAFGIFRLVGTLEARGTDPGLTYVVKRGDLLITITEDGNLESSQNVDIKCEVAGGSTILWIVEDGKEVQQGEVLARLDSSQLEDQINQQRINYEKARATHIQSAKDYEVAKIAVEEYLEGTYRQQLQEAEAKITIAEENLRSAENTLQHTQTMFRKGYVTLLQLETQQFAVEKAKLDLASAQTAKEVLTKYTKVKTLQDLESKRDAAEAKKNSDKAAFDLEEARLKRLEAQLQKCTIRAPKSGMVVYANEQSRMRFGPQQATEIKEGAAVREQQAIFRLPDLSNMQARVTVHESKVDRVRRGMRARIRVQDQEFQGTVISVANQPEPASFFSAAVKEYATIVKIDGQSKELRPGMTAEVEILLDHLKNVIFVPVSAVFQEREQTFCYVKKGSEIEKRPVVLGMSNDQFVEIRSGLAEGEEVLRNPPIVVPETPAEAPKAETVDVGKKFGKAEGGPAGPGPEATRARPGARTLPGPEGPGKPETEPGRKAGPRKRPDLMKLDKNGDKRISREEAPPEMAPFFDQVDANGDGFIDQAEIKAMMETMRKLAPGGGPPGGLPGGPAPLP
ncbi:MAG: efflux RND transporter periplasmic adaptor subunit [Thermoguttaceae bacterium]